jgi:sugar lactone lactonase YvrE
MMMKNFSRFLLATGVLATSFLAVNVRAAVGDVYETNEGNILRFRTLGGTPATWAPGFSNPKGLVFDGNGHLYVADPGKNAILQMMVPDASGITYLSGLNAPTGVALDSAGNLYVSEAGTGNILKFAPTVDKTKTTFAANTGASAGLAFDSSGNLYSADFNNGKIYKFTPDGTKTTFATGLNLPAGLAVDSAGNVFEADSGSGNINKFAPDGTQTNFVKGLSRPYGLAFDSNGNLIVADNETGATLRYTPDGTKSIIFQSDFNTPAFVAVEPAQHHLLNISTRGFVQGGNNTLIAGFVVGGNGPVGTTVIIRALGPSLSAFGITDPLPDPILELHDSSGAVIASNNDWQDSQSAVLQSSGLAPSDSHESAIQATLPGGAYTAVVGTVTGAPGTALVEVYQLP